MSAATTPTSMTGIALIVVAEGFGTRKKKAGSTMNRNRFLSILAGVNYGIAGTLFVKALATGELGFFWVAVFDVAAGTICLLTAREPKGIGGQ